MKLSPRLLRMAAHIPEEVVVADIGTDHAYLPVYLVVTGRCPRAIAGDTSSVSLESARATVVEFGLADKVDLRLGAGLSILRPREADVVVMAGLGGKTMVEILAADPEVRDTVGLFIFQPMSDSGHLRRWLINTGYAIRDEELVPEDDRILEIIVAEPGTETVEEEILYEVGPRLVSKGDPLFVTFVKRKLDECRRIFRQIEAGPGSRDQRYWEFASKIQKFEEILKQVY